MEVLKSKVELLTAQNAQLSKELQKKGDEELLKKLGEGEEGGEEEQNLKEGEEEASENDEYYIIKRCEFDGVDESVSAEGARRLRDGGGGGPCEEIYVVKKGETLQTISVKCETIMILDDNPQIQDTDDIGPGTVLLIRP
ncbi:hypothetical protein QJS04_geneDACA015504 [Acorus gramineus]|uniref:LysM domain-containing protein n=1 Tax=Acorus gramineus TaxID=55184 RepID=A0AAV9AQQ1_ACOGR|nr:hypothetical protein QJS04_geneDACA015504 [Acorus gramineus]